MKKYLMTALILVVTGAFATSAYADWAEISESSTRDAEFFGEAQAEQAKQISDVKLRQLSEQAEQLSGTSASVAATAETIAAATLVGTQAASLPDSDSQGAAALGSGSGLMFVRDDDTGSGIGSSGTGDDTPGDNPADNPPLVIDNPKGDIVPEDIGDDVPSIPGSPGDPDPPPHDPVAAAAIEK